MYPTYTPPHLTPHTAHTQSFLSSASFRFRIKERRNMFILCRSSYLLMSKLRATRCVLVQVQWGASTPCPAYISNTCTCKAANAGSESVIMYICLTLAEQLDQIKNTMQCKTLHALHLSPSSLPLVGVRLGSHSQADTLPAH